MFFKTQKNEDFECLNNDCRKYDCDFPQCHEVVLDYNYYEKNKEDIWNKIVSNHKLFIDGQLNGNYSIVPKVKISFKIEKESEDIQN